MRVALATAAHLPHGSEDDQVLIASMRAAGIEPVPAVWDAAINWSEFDVIILRSIWDYHLKYPRFVAWLTEIDRTGVPVHNSTKLVRWNADKSYMLDLERAGVRITPSRLVKTKNAFTLREIATATGWTQLVVKPTVASTGYETWLIDAAVSAADEARFQEQKSRMDVLVQEFAAGVQAGELSMVFLNGNYSHAVLKRAAGSEFRVHIEHGGTVDNVQPDPDQLAWAKQVLAAVRQPWTYARVDAVIDASGPMLMELELLDPELFFKHKPAAAHELVKAISARTHAR